MKILAIVPSYHDAGRTPSKFLCELDNDEMKIIASGACGGEYSGDFRMVREIELSKKFRHAMEVLRKCHEASKIPGTLRAIADLMAIVVPAIEEVAKEEEQQSDVVA